MMTATKCNRQFLIAGTLLFALGAVKAGVIMGTTSPEKRQHPVPEFTAAQSDTASIPEPETLSTIAVGLIMLGIFARRRKRR